MILPSLRYERPGSLDRALDLLAEPGTRPLAGGQSLVNVLKLRATTVEALVDISTLEELRFVRSRPDGGLEIGACVSYDELDRDRAIRERSPRIAEVASHTVDQQVRCCGTIGGNCCYADPASNFPPLMVALDATMRIVAQEGVREVAAEQFFKGFAKTAVGHGELLHSIIVPPRDDGQGVGYQSLQIARDSWALARAVVALRAHGIVEEARVVLGAVATVPLRQPAVESAVVGRDPSPALLGEAASQACEAIEPISDVHASGTYRRQMAKVMTGRALLQALGDATADQRPGR